MMKFLQRTRDAVARHPNPLLAGILLGLIVGTLNLLPIVRCPWCSGEIRHYGGRLRHCHGDDVGCDGNGWTSLRSRYDWLLWYQSLVSLRH